MISVIREKRYARRTADAMRKATARLADESGSFVVWSLFSVIFILLAVGLGIDTVRTEIQRTKIQQTLDAAILAAADLEQDLDPIDVVNDYFTRAGLEPGLVQIEPVTGVNTKQVTARLNTRVQTMFLDMIGVDSLPAPAVGTAIESITDVEVALVLDNSGSMGWDNNYRLNLLKPAAQDFVDAVVRDPSEPGAGSVSLSIVPYATQVNAGPVLGAALNFTGEHNRSYCAEFSAESFSEEAIDPQEQLRRVSHFDAFTWNIPLPNPDFQNDVGVVCPRDESRHITAWSTDSDTLKEQIEAMYAWGNTSIDVAAKWGAAMLDPAFRPVLDQLEASGDVDSSLIGQPFDYNRPNTKKFLVVMSDGQNTNQFRLRDGYRTGASTLWRDPGTGTYSFYDQDGDQFFVFNDPDLKNEPGGTWEDEAAGGEAATNLSWQDVWAAMSVRRFARDVMEEALGGTWETYRNQIQTATGPNTKNDRVVEICDAARDAGVIIYTIGVNTYGQGDQTMEDCAGSATNFFDVELDEDEQEMAQAFAAIARQINQLRLTQ